MRTKIDNPVKIEPESKGPTGKALSEHVYQVLRDAILTLQLPPGALIDKSSICEQLGVSKFPVAAALSRLKEEGLVEVRPRSGSVVSRIQTREVLQAAFIRRALEIETVWTLAPIVTPQLIKRLERNLLYQRFAVEQKHWVEFHEFDVEFHTILLDELAYPRVQQVLERSRGSLDRARWLNAPQRQHDVILQEHTQIKEELANRNSAKAADAMRIHLDAGFAQVAAYMDANPSKFDPR